jgi:hypothetical protein
MMLTAFGSQGAQRMDEQSFALGFLIGGACTTLAMWAILNLIGALDAGKPNGEPK